MLWLNMHVPHARIAISTTENNASILEVFVCTCSVYELSYIPWECTLDKRHPASMIIMRHA